MNQFQILLKATLQMYETALRDGSKSLLAHFWIVGLVPAYTIGLQLVGVLTIPLGFAGGIVQYLALAACLSSFLCIIAEVIAHQRVNFAALSGTFGRYFSSVISVMFVLWIVDLLLGFLSQSQANALWLILFIKAALFLVLNPIPELIYQGHRDGMGLLEDAYQFTRANTAEWLIPAFLMMSPFFLADITTGFLAISRIGPTNALDLVATLLLLGMPTINPVTILITTLLASILITWIMLCRGYLFRALNRGGRRQRIFAARMED